MRLPLHASFTVFLNASLGLINHQQKIFEILSKTCAWVENTVLAYGGERWSEQNGFQVCSQLHASVRLAASAQYSGT